MEYNIIVQEKGGKINVWKLFLSHKWECTTNLAQQRMNNLQNQYNQMFPQQEMMQQQVPQQMQMIKGRPVSSLEEARASMIDLDGSMYV